jgi:hypothetical protein
MIRYISFPLSQASPGAMTPFVSYGKGSWVEQLARRLGLDLTERPRGRPRKKEK